MFKNRVQINRLSGVDVLYVLGDCRRIRDKLSPFPATIVASGTGLYA